MTTYSTKPTDIVRAWHVVDAEDLVLGRLCTEVARLLRGKHKPYFAPHLDTGDHVVVVNSAKVIMTAGKAEKTLKYRHSGFPGGLSQATMSDLMDKRPNEVIRKTVKGMLPKGALGAQMLRKLKVYEGAEHPHQAQNPQPLTIDGARRRDS